MQVFLSSCRVPRRIWKARKWNTPNRFTRMFSVKLKVEPFILRSILFVLLYQDVNVLCLLSLKHLSLYLLGLKQLFLYQQRIVCQHLLVVLDPDISVYCIISNFFNIFVHISNWLIQLGHICSVFWTRTLYLFYYPKGM